jgi:hypothetical protein
VRYELSGTPLVIIGYYLQKNQRNYEDLGGDYFDRIDSDGLKRYFVRRLEKLGYKVTLVPIMPPNQLLLICVFEGEGRSPAGCDTLPMFEVLEAQ